MKSLPKILLTLGILMSAGGIGAAGLLYRDMKSETLKHARTGDIALSLAEASGWKNSACSLFRSGTHSVVLTLTPRPGVRQPPAEYTGALDVEVSFPDGRMALQRSVQPKGIALPIPDSGMSVVLATFDVAEPTEESWTVRARVAAPNSVFAAVDAEISVLPPQIYEIGSYIADRIYLLIGLGVVALSGFGIIVYAASMQEQARGRATAARA
jgi:hypothetical protein